MLDRVSGPRAFLHALEKSAFLADSCSRVT